MKTIINEINNATATYNDETYTLTVTANDGYKFEVAPEGNYEGKFGVQKFTMKLSRSQMKTPSLRDGK